jgi:hypothetical protein
LGGALRIAAEWHQRSLDFVHPEANGATESVPPEATIGDHVPNGAIGDAE